MRKNNIRLTGCVGDGDSKVYHAIVEEKPHRYCFEIKKYEYIDHIQKRLGRNLRNLKSKTGKKKLADGKTIGGKGRLSQEEIDRLPVQTVQPTQHVKVGQLLEFTKCPHA